MHLSVKSESLQPLSILLSTEVKYILLFIEYKHNLVVNDFRSSISTNSDRKSKLFFSRLFTLKLQLTNTYYFIRSLSLWQFPNGCFVAYPFDSLGVFKKLNCNQIVGRLCFGLSNEQPFIMHSVFMLFYHAISSKFKEKHRWQNILLRYLYPALSSYWILLALKI